MRTRLTIISAVRTVAFGLVCCMGAGLHGQAFDSGSNGTYGAIDVSSNTTLDLPDDGVFHATTINIASGATLSFNANAWNAPVYLLATGDVTLAGNVVVSGTRGTSTTGGVGGPGGFNGGNPGSVATSPGSGYGPGGGGGGSSGNTAGSAAPGVFASRTSLNTTNQGNPYGSALVLPLIGGSGGGGVSGTPGTGGGGGGGAVLIASSTRIDFVGNAQIQSRGGNYLGTSAYNGGSGGGIRLVAPAVTASGATLDVQGGTVWSGRAGPGRIRIDTLDRSSLGFNFLPGGVTSIGSLMLTFPSPTPRLDIVEAAGTAIALDSGPVLVNLPFGSTAVRSVKVRATDFNAIVPISVVLTPDHGDVVAYEAEIDNQAANPAEVTVDVTLPVNVQTLISAWTR